MATVIAIPIYIHGKVRNSVLNFPFPITNTTTFLKISIRLEGPPFNFSLQMKWTKYYIPFDYEHAENSFRSARHLCLRPAIFNLSRLSTAAPDHSRAHRSNRFKKNPREPAESPGPPRHLNLCTHTTLADRRCPRFAGFTTHMAGYPEPGSFLEWFQRFSIGQRLLTLIICGRLRKFASTWHSRYFWEMEMIASQHTFLWQLYGRWFTLWPKGHKFPFQRAKRQAKVSLFQVLGFHRFSFWQLNLQTGRKQTPFCFRCPSSAILLWFSQSFCPFMSTNLWPLFAVKVKVVLGYRIIERGADQLEIANT